MNNFFDRPVVILVATKGDYAEAFIGGEHYSWFRIGQWEAHVQREDSDCSKIQMDSKGLVGISQL